MKRRTLREEALVRTGLSFGWREGGISENFVTLIYRKAFNIIENGRGWTAPTYKVSLDGVWTKNLGLGLAWTKETEKAVKAKKVHEDMLDELQESEYLDMAKELLEDEKKLSKFQEELIRIINDFYSIPIFKGTCKYIKRALPSGFF